MVLQWVNYPYSLRKEKKDHIMKQVIYGLIAALAFTATAVTAQNGPKDINSIVDVAVEANSPNGAFPGVFDTLIALLTEDVPGRAQILNTLDGKGQFTVFAPTDDAFEALTETALTLGYCSLGDLDSDLVNEVLLYHVARGRRDSSDVLDSDQIRMLSRDFLQQSAAVLTDNLGRQSNLIPGAIDVAADNGFIHAIDAVVLPVLPEPGPGNCL
jgi:uncharacterized surface protein with fasciclin (FAS1) repeats